MSEVSEVWSWRKALITFFSLVTVAVLLPVIKMYKMILMMGK